MEEKEAISLLKQGNINGLESLVEQHQLQAVRVAYLITGDQSISENIVQDTFLHIYHRIDRFDSNRPFGPWFMRIVMNNAMKVASRNNKQLSLSQNTNDDTANLGNGLFNKYVDDPAALVEQAETSEAVLFVLDRLSSAQRTVIVQKYYLDMNETEMAAALGSAPGKVKWHLHHARKRLRSLLVRLNPQG